MRTGLCRTVVLSLCLSLLLSGAVGAGADGGTSSSADRPAAEFGQRPLVSLQLFLAGILAIILSGNIIIHWRKGR